MADERIYMLNALWFKKEGGAETYQQYVEAVQPILAELGAKPMPAYQPQQALIGDFDPDVFFLVEYPSLEAFQALLTHQGYAKIRHLREDALEKSLLIRCSKAALG